MFHPIIQGKTETKSLLSKILELISISYTVLLAATVLSGAARSQMGPACAGAPNEMFVRNSMSCADYYHCSDEIPESGRCPAAFAFDAFTQTCNSEYSVDCTQCSPFGIQNLEDPNDCRRFYRCVAGQRTHRTCADNLVFDPSIGDCNVGSSAHCSADNSVCSSFSHIGFLRIGDPTDCSK